jgi:hypothetical protein
MRPKRRELIAGQPIKVARYRKGNGRRVTMPETVYFSAPWRPASVELVARAIERTRTKHLACWGDMRGDTELSLRV